MSLLPLAAGAAGVAGLYLLLKPPPPPTVAAMPVSRTGGYCDRPPTGNWLADVMQTGYCGFATVVGTGTDAASSVAANVTDIPGEVGPLGLGGLAFGGVVATVGGALLAAGVADVVFTGGSGIRSVAAAAGLSRAHR